MSGALLSEVWPDMVQKPKKTKRLKKKKGGDPLMDPPLEPDEMETELLDDRENNELDPRKRLSGMRVSPYTDNETQYQNNKRVVDLEFNNNIVRADMMRNIKRESVLSDDPEYQEFLEFKRMKMMKSQKSSSKSGLYLESSTEEQFNELLLYVFTGFFLLMIYDNIYKLGKDTSFY
tara:strand:+ start:146 stop:673 length:528 start_codon:yes stop_codon:yes gene_type:complete